MTQIEKTNSGYSFKGSPGLSHAMAMGILLAGSTIFTIGCLLMFQGFVAEGQESFVWFAVSIVPIALGVLMAYTGYRNPTIDMKIDRENRQLIFVYYSNGKISKEMLFALSDIRAIITENSDGDESLRDAMQDAPDGGHKEYVVVKLKSGRENRFPASYPESREIQKILREAVNAVRPMPKEVRGKFGRKAA